MQHKCVLLHLCLPSLLLLHQTHHPLSTAILNEVNTSERWADLRSVLEAHRNVRLVLTGHFHKVGLQPSCMAGLQSSLPAGGMPWQRKQRGAAQGNSGEVGGWEHCAHEIQKLAVSSTLHRRPKVAPMAGSRIAAAGPGLGCHLPIPNPHAACHPLLCTKLLCAGSAPGRHLQVCGPGPFVWAVPAGLATMLCLPGLLSGAAPAAACHCLSLPILLLTAAGWIGRRIGEVGAAATGGRTPAAAGSGRAQWRAATQVRGCC